MRGVAAVPFTTLIVRLEGYCFEWWTTLLATYASRTKRARTSGSEPATVAELDTRVAAEEPIVLYWWTPTAAVATYDLVNVPLPEYSDECYANPAQIDCDYPEDVLFKAASAGLSDKAPDVYSFLESFRLTTEDQLSMLPAVELEGRDPAEVAAEWIEANESTWRAWLP